MESFRSTFGMVGAVDPVRDPHSLVRCLFERAVASDAANFESASMNCSEHFKELFSSEEKLDAVRPRPWRAIEPTERFF